MCSKEEKDTSIAEVEEEQYNPLADLQPQMVRFVHLYMTGQYSMAKLAQLLDVHVNTIHNWMRREDVRTAINDMQVVTHEVISGQMKSMTQKAIDRMRDLMDSPIDGVALQAVKDILDRAGHKPKQEITKNVNVRTFEEKLHDVINDTIDVDYEEVEDDNEDA